MKNFKTGDIVTFKMYKSFLYLKEYYDRNFSNHQTFIIIDDFLVKNSGIKRVLLSNGEIHLMNSLDLEKLS